MNGHLANESFLGWLKRMQARRARIAALKIKGFRAKEIADKLGMSQKAVEFQWKKAKRDIRSSSLSLMGGHQ